MADFIGQALGNYRLVRLLGKGGFADVYLGEHIYLRTFAAIKVLHTLLAAGEGTSFFQREARILASLHHPNILPILDFGILENGTPYIVMSYAPNGTLRHHHPRGSQLPLTTVLSYVKPVAAALQYAHDKGIVHRDIKPENMLLSSNNEVLLSDFGIATLAESSRFQSTQEVLGTISYMAPEQLDGKSDPASDQYSLGVVIYEWITGKRPFSGSFTELAVKHMVESPPPLREAVSDISPEVEQVVLTALAKDPRQRFARVQAFANAFEQAVINQPGSPFVFTPPSAVPLPEPNQKRTSPPIFYPTPNEAIQSPYGGYNAPAAPILLRPSGPLELPVASSRSQAKRVSRRAVLVGLVGIVGLAAAEAVTAIRSSRASQSSTPTPTLPKIVIYRGHSDEVNAVNWSPDGKLIASGSRDDTARVWNSSTGNTIYTYSSNHSSVFGVVWSPNGQQIASAGADDTVQVWNATNGQHVLTYPGHSNAVLALAWSPNGKYIASGSLDNTVQVWDAITGNHIFTYKGHAAGVSAVTWSPDSSRIASASADKTVQIWDAATGMNRQIYGNHSAGVTTVEWSPDGQYIASGSIDKTVRVWDAPTVGKTFTFTYSGHSGQVNTLAWSPDSKLIASGGDDHTVRVWNTAQTFSFIYHGHSNWVRAVAWSPIDRRLASAGADRTVQVWRVT
jgi:eukaryotic-like serine/threonine-protein kinase